MDKSNKCELFNFNGHPDPEIANPEAIIITTASQFF